MKQIPHWRRRREPCATANTFHDPVQKFGVKRSSPTLAMIAVMAVFSARYAGSASARYALPVIVFDQSNSLLAIGDSGARQIWAPSGVRAARALPTLARPVARRAATARPTIVLATKGNRGAMVPPIRRRRARALKPITPLPAGKSAAAVAPSNLKQKTGASPATTPSRGKALAK